jgi:hypothetical protein
VNESDLREIAPLIEHFVEKLVAGETRDDSAKWDLMMELRRKGLWDFDEDWLKGVLDLNSWLRGSWRNYDWQRRSSAVLDQWPAQEFFRAYPRAVHRDWLSRWTKAGGHLYDGKMVALKDDPIWYPLSDFQLPFPPFAPDSGMDVRDIDRDTSMKLELIDRDRQVSPKEVARPRLILLPQTPEENVSQ